MKGIISVKGKLANKNISMKGMIPKSFTSEAVV